MSALLHCQHNHFHLHRHHQPMCITVNQMYKGNLNLRHHQQMLISFLTFKSLISIIHSSNSLSSCSSSLCKTSAITSSNDNFLCLLEQSAILLSTLKTSYHYWGHKFSIFLAFIISKQASMLVSSNSCVSHV